MNFSYTQKKIIELAKENNFPIQNFNKQSYVYINGKVLNSNTGAEVTNPKILTLFNAPIPVDCAVNCGCFHDVPTKLCAPRL